MDQHIACLKRSSLKKAFADNLLTPMSSSQKEMKFFDENIPGFLSINTLQCTSLEPTQTVQGPNDRFSANCKLFKGL